MVEGRIAVSGVLNAAAAGVFQADRAGREAVRHR
jgi:hypothetical protein